MTGKPFLLDDLSQKPLRIFIKESYPTKGLSVPLEEEVPTPLGCMEGWCLG